MKLWKQTALYCTFQLPLTPSRPRAGRLSDGKDKSVIPLCFTGDQCIPLVYSSMHCFLLLSNAVIDCIFMSYCHGVSGFVRSIQRENKAVVLCGSMVSCRRKHDKKNKTIKKNVPIVFDPGFNRLMRLHLLPVLFAVVLIKKALNGQQTGIQVIDMNTQDEVRGFKLTACSDQPMHQFTIKEITRQKKHCNND